jgi:hypothetical protein
MEKKERGEPSKTAADMESVNQSTMNGEEFSLRREKRS